MGFQAGLIRFTGTLGEVTFFRKRDGTYMARKKSGVDAKRMHTDPAFARTRENWAEFGRAAAARKLLTLAFRPLAASVADSTVSGRLQRQMMRVVKADKINVRGMRNVTDGNITLLTGFEFDGMSSIATTFLAHYTSVINRTAGTLHVSVPAFNPMEMIAAPQGATHCRLIAGGAEIDFENNTYMTATSLSNDISLTATAQQALVLSQSVTPTSSRPLFLVFGIIFLQEVNGMMSKLQNANFNALAIVATNEDAEHA